jgi:hypothetical protein
MFARVGNKGRSNLLVELLMIVVGINIALWFEGVFDDLRDAETEQQYLSGLKDDLLSDIRHLESVISENEAKLERLQEIIPALSELDKADPETQASALFQPSSYMFFHPSDFTYRSMQESGDFRLLSEEKTKTSLLRLNRFYSKIEMLQVNFIQAMDDEYIPIFMRSFDLIENRLSDQDILNNLVFRNFFAYALDDTNDRLGAYVAAKKMAEELLALIDQQLK